MSQQKFYVYLLQSERSGIFYIGQTEDLAIRLKRHNNGLVSSTKKNTPWKLIGFEKCASREKARWLEYKLKNNYSEKKRFLARFCPRSPMDRTQASEA